jgi:hypothetical protein
MARIRSKKWAAVSAAAFLGIGLATGLIVRRELPAHDSRQPLSPDFSSRKPKSSGIENPDATVWVNTDSGTYHCPGTRWYGKTHTGKYMKQKEARAEGDHPSGNHPCT